MVKSYSTQILSTMGKRGRMYNVCAFDPVCPLTDGKKFVRYRSVERFHFAYLKGMHNGRRQKKNDYFQYDHLCCFDIGFDAGIPKSER